jgi:hypothetical protein
MHNWYCLRFSYRNCIYLHLFLHINRLHSQMCLTWISREWLFMWISREPFTWISCEIHVKFTWKNSREIHVNGESREIHVKKFTWNSCEWWITWNSREKIHVKFMWMAIHVKFTWKYSHEFYMKNLFAWNSQKFSHDRISHKKNYHGFWMSCN